MFTCAVMYTLRHTDAQTPVPNTQTVSCLGKVYVQLLKT